VSIGLKLDNGVKISIEDRKEELVNKLEKAQVNFNIPFEKENNQGVKETLVTLEQYGIEITLDNEEVTYIKSASNEYSIINGIEIEENDSIDEQLKTIRDCIQKMYLQYSVRFERIDTKSMNIAIVLTEKENQSDKLKVRITVIMNRNKKIFINTIRKVE